MSTHSGPPRHREWKLGCKVYIGNLAEGASKADIEETFSKYGPLRNVWVARNPPGFAFVEFEDGRDAEDACRHLDGTRIAGGRIKAEMSHGRTRRGSRPGPPGGFRPGGPPGYPMNGAYPMSRGHGMYGGPRGGHYNGGGPGEYPYHHGGPRGGPHHVPPPVAGYPPMDIRGPPGARGGDRHVPRPRSPIGMTKEFRHYSRSRSNSLGKSPPPVPRTTTARPRTPPSRSVSPSERH